MAKVEHFRETVRRARKERVRNERREKNQSHLGLHRLLRDLHRFQLPQDLCQYRIRNSHLGL